MALAGIMGGELSKVAEETDSLLLEVATFDAVTEAGLEPRGR